MNPLEQVKEITLIHLRFHVEEALKGEPGHCDRIRELALKLRIIVKNLAKTHIVCATCKGDFPVGEVYILQGHKYDCYCKPCHNQKNLDNQSRRRELMNGRYRGKRYAKKAA